MADLSSANCAILLTPPGPAAIAVVRIVGPAVPTFLQQHFSARPAQGRCVHGELTDGGRVIDDVVVVLIDGGADVNLHGGAWVVRSFLDLAERSGFQVVTPALPLADAAVDASSVLEREMLAHLPMARTELAVTALLAQLEAWRNLRGEDTGHVSELADAMVRDRALWWLLHPPRVAIIGAPNVGKSTLANQLFAQERSITADLPGTTRDWVGEIANIDGLAVMLVDTPGQRATNDPIEQEAIQRSSQQISSADLVLLVLDSTLPYEGDQRRLAESFPSAIRIINKCDKRPVWDSSAEGGVRTTATTGQGMDEVRRRIRQRFGCDELDPQRPRWWTERQRGILESAIADPGQLRQMWGEA